MPPARDQAHLSFRLAGRADILAAVRMLADDVLGATREQFTDPLPQCYYAAFEAIDSDPNNELVVAESERRIVGMLQLTFIPSLTHAGSWRAQIEGVRVRSDARGSGVGRRMIEWAIARARARGCRIMQLTTDKRRPDARLFYESLGFEATHEGMKLQL